MKKDFYYKPGSSVVNVPEDAEPLSNGVSQKPIFENDKIAIRQLQLKALQNLPQGNLSYGRFYIVLKGNVTVDKGDEDTTALHNLSQNGLVYIPQKVDAATRLRAGQSEAQILEVQMLNPKTEAQSLRLKQGIWVDQQFMVIEKTQAKAYVPAHHDNTFNHCLLINDDIEILHSCIDVGGGADVHAHEHEDQCTYVMEPAPSKLLYYPMGVQHGGITNIEKRHNMILMYFPPQGECLESA